MNIEKEKIEDLIKEWMIFREENLSKLTSEDKKHLFDYDTFSKNILRNVSPNSKQYVQKQLDKIYDSFMDYANYWNNKYYRAGFGDSLNLVITTLGGSGIASK